MRCTIEMTPNIINTTIILIINLLIVLYSLLLNKKIFKSYAYISLPFLFNLFFVFFYVGIYAYVIYSGNTYKYFCFTKDFTYPWKAIVFFTFCNLAYNIGGTLILAKKRKYSIHKFVSKYIRVYNVIQLKRIALLIFSIGFISKLLYFTMLGHGNLFFYIQNYFKIQVESVGNGVGFEFYLRFLFSLIILGATILFSYTLITRKSIILTSSVIFLTILSNFESRLSILAFMLQLIILSCFYSKRIRNKIPYYFLIYILPLFFVIIIGLGLFRDSTNNKIYQNLDLVYFALGNIHNSRALSDGLELDSKYDKKYYGATIVAPILFKSIPRKIWPNKPLNAAAIYTETVSPGILQQGFAFAPGLVYESYINFGYLGSFIYFLLIGYFIYFIQIILLKEFFINRFNVFFPIIMSFMSSKVLYLRGEDVTLIFVYSSFFMINYFLLFGRFKIKSIRGDI